VKIADGEVTAGDLADNSVASAEVVNESLTASDLAACPPDARKG
jgi:hypothetical protein